MQSIDPTTGELVQHYHEHTLEAARSIAQKACVAADEWHRVPVDERADSLRRLERILLDDRSELAELMAREMGKPVAEGSAEIEKCAKLCGYYAERGPAFLQSVPVPTEAASSYVAFEPLGVVLAIMPWNFPFWQVFRAAVPALLAGNAVVLKHASNVCGCAAAAELAFRRAGFPEGLFTALFLGSEDALRLIDDDHIAAVTLTGSTSAGRQVAARAGQNLKKTVLELGGSDAYVVLADADLEAASRVCVQSRLINTGQSCIAAKRFVVVSQHRAEFEERVVALMGAARQGDPRDPTTEIGPMARTDLRDELHSQVQKSIARGATLRLGGVVPSGPGAWYPATVLGNVVPGMPAYDEELFGPAAAIIEARDEEHALAIANDSRFGLGAAVFTRDRERGERLARERLQAGSCFVNTLVRSDPRLPFGGVRESGYGRELGEFGIREFVNIKTVYVA